MLSSLFDVFSSWECPEEESEDVSSLLDELLTDSPSDESSESLSWKSRAVALE